MEPKVTVLMAVYNGAAFLGEAVESILSQTFSDFEFLIINDGSTDSSRDIILSYKDARIRLIDNETNMGLIASLNLGIESAKGEYIARQDDDDVSLTSRLTVQVDYLDNHPEVGLVGSGVDFIDEKGAPAGKWRTPTTNSLIRWSLLFGTCVAHPTAVLRRSVLERSGGYDQNALYAEDHDLWCRLSHYTGIANLPELLVKKRIHESAVSVKYFETQEETEARIIRGEISKVMKHDVPENEVVSLYKGVTGRLLDKGDEVVHSAQLVSALYQRYVLEVPMTSFDLKQVRKDAARRIAIIASNHARTLTKEAVSASLKAVALNPLLLLSLWPLKFAAKFFGFRRVKPHDIGRLFLLGIL